MGFSTALGDGAAGQPAFNGDLAAFSHAEMAPAPSAAPGGCSVGWEPRRPYWCCSPKGIPGNLEIQTWMEKSLLGEGAGILGRWKIERVETQPPPSYKRSGRARGAHLGTAARSPASGCSALRRKFEGHANHFLKIVTALSPLEVMKAPAKNRCVHRLLLGETQGKRGRGLPAWRGWCPQVPTCGSISFGYLDPFLSSN